MSTGDSIGLIACEELGRESGVRTSVLIIHPDRRLRGRCLIINDIRVRHEGVHDCIMNPLSWHIVRRSAQQVTNVDLYLTDGSYIMNPFMNES
jgi:hypothetical protein